EVEVDMWCLRAEITGIDAHIHDWLGPVCSHELEEVVVIPNFGSPVTLVAAGEVHGQVVIRFLSLVPAVGGGIVAHLSPVATGACFGPSNKAQRRTIARFRQADQLSLCVAVDCVFRAIVHMVPL